MASRKLPVVAALLAAGFVGLAVYHWLNRDRYRVNAGLLAELRSANFTASPKLSPGDWPQWRGVNRDGVSTESGLLTEWPADGPPVVWQAEVGRGYSSMAVTRGRVFTQFQDGVDSVVICFDATDGKLLWRYRYPCPSTGDAT